MQPGTILVFLQPRCSLLFDLKQPFHAAVELTLLTGACRLDREAHALIKGGLVPDFILTDHISGMTSTDLAWVLKEQ